MLGGASLEREARAVAALLAAERLPEARQRLTHLVGRDTCDLDEDEVARAVGRVRRREHLGRRRRAARPRRRRGRPRLLGYRAANTLDAMVGHRSARYSEFGWASARLDDLLNLPGSRLTALLAALLGPAPRAALAAWRRDASAHPSPNAGPVEASFAGALGIRLGGEQQLRRPRRAPRRPRLRPRADMSRDIERAITARPPRRRSRACRRAASRGSSLALPPL